jgi:hypothetical protein
MGFLTEPISGAFLMLSAASVFWHIFQAQRAKSAKRRAVVELEA